MKRLSLLFLLLPGLALAQPLTQEPNTWVKRSPQPGGPRNPMLGYEASLAYDPVARKIIRWAGHTQTGGHEQINETWTYDPRTQEFKLLETNLAPPGACCAQQNVFDPAAGRFLRFRGFSGNHGWHWFRENYLNNSSVWSFDLPTKTWRNMRPMPEPHVSGLRCAAWDAEHQVVVVFGGEGNSEGTVVYDPYDNTWTRMHPKLEPSFRSGGNMAYDSRRKRHILFGAQFTDDPHTWAYDLRKNEWTDLKPKVQPPTDANDAVLVYDDRNDVIVCSVKSTGREDAPGSYETWVYLGDENTWRPMEPKVSPPGFGNRRRIMCYVPDLNLTVMENYVNPSQRIPGVEREQQMWTYRYGVPMERERIAELVKKLGSLTFAERAGAQKELEAIGVRALEGLRKAGKGGDLETNRRIEDLIRKLEPAEKKLPAPRWSFGEEHFGLRHGLGWMGVQGAKSYEVYEGAGSIPWLATYKLLGVKRFEEMDLRAEIRGTYYTMPWPKEEFPKFAFPNWGPNKYYYIVAKDAHGQSGEPSRKLRTKPPVVESLVVSVLAERQVGLRFPPKSDRPELFTKAYHVERAVVEVFSEDQLHRLRNDTEPLAEPSVGAIRAISEFKRLTEKPIYQATYMDTSVDLSKPAVIEGNPIYTHRFSKAEINETGKPYRYAVYAYRVREVNRAGDEGGPSPYVLTIPRSPENLYAKEVDDDCYLKWSPNRENGVKGYRVYRMESPRINGPGQKVTRVKGTFSFQEKPVFVETFLDKGVGKKPRRYWVMAIDALGQEGYPSAPAWHYREMRAQYLPFTGEWHQ